MPQQQEHVQSWQCKVRKYPTQEVSGQESHSWLWKPLSSMLNVLTLAADTQLYDKSTLHVLRGTVSIPFFITCIFSRANWGEEQTGPLGGSKCLILLILSSGVL